MEVDDGVASFDQMGPNLVGDTPGGGPARIPGKLSVEVPSVGKIPGFHAIAREVHNGNNSQRSSHALWVKRFAFVGKRIAQQMRTGGGPGQFVSVDATYDGDAGPWPCAVNDGDWDGPGISEADVEKRELDGSQGSRFDALSKEPNITPFGIPVPFRAIFGLMGFHRFINSHTSAFGKFMSDTNLPDGFLFPPGHDSSKHASIINAPLEARGKNHEATDASYAHK